MKHFKKKITCMSLALSMCLGTLSYGIEYDSDNILIERSMKDVGIEKSSEDSIEWTPPKVDSSNWAIDELYDARVYNLITYSLARDVKENMNRADAAELGVQLYERLAGKKVTGELKDPFADTDNRSVLKAYKLGIVKGVRVNEYVPEADVTRQDLAVILFNALSAYEKSSVEAEQISGYEDKDDISGYARESMGYMISNGFIKGRTENMIQPRANTKKEEALIIAKRMYEVIRDQKEQTSKGLFYKVGDEKGNELYLLGSIHIAKEEAYPLKKEIREAFAEADVVSLEIDTSDENKVSDKVLSQIFYEEGKTIKDDISEELYSELEGMLDQYKLISMSDIENYKPWYLNIVLPMLIGMEDMSEADWDIEVDPSDMTEEELEELENSPYKYTPGIDKYFAERSHIKGKEVSELEGVDYQLNMYRNMTGETQEELLRMTVKDIVEGNVKEDSNLDIIMEVWKNSDHEGLEHIIEGSMEGMPEEYNEALWHRRNREMADRIENYIKDTDSHFVVVGAGHLVGETSIINLLDKNGYTIEKID